MPPMTLSHFLPCNSHSIVLAHQGQGGMAGAGGRVPRCTPHLETPGSQAPNQQHPRAGASLARSQQSHCTKNLPGGK